MNFEAFTGNHCWLWWFNQPERLSEAAIDQILDNSNELWFSVASMWEIGIKVAIGKLPLISQTNRLH